MIFSFFVHPISFSFFFTVKNNRLFFLFFFLLPVGVSLFLASALFSPPFPAHFSAGASQPARGSRRGCVAKRAESKKKGRPSQRLFFIISFTSCCLGRPEGPRLFSFRVFFLGTAGAHDSRCPSSFEKKKKRKKDTRATRAIHPTIGRGHWHDGEQTVGASFFI